MPEDYYGDGDAAPSEGGATAPDELGGEQPHDTGTTAVVPSELCPGMKVGDEMVLKIVGVDDDSYEVAYAPKEGKPDEQEETPAPASAPEGSMASMME
jgi:hypothetical protein